MRLDLFLVQQKLASSRTQAKDFIDNGFVFLKQNNQIKKLSKASFEVTVDIEPFIIIEKNELQKFVSRAGLKLEAALDYLQVSVEGLHVLDIGQSTGGFSDCLYQKKVAQVVGVDVGHNQLHESLKNNSKIISIEGLNAKDLSTNSEFKKFIPENGFDLVVMDVSFISITKVIQFVKPFLKKEGHYLFLVKPQFEAGPNALDKNGIVKDDKTYTIVENIIKDEIEKCFGDVEKYFNSAVVGKDGNQEFFIYGKKKL